MNEVSHNTEAFKRFLFTFPLESNFLFNNDSRRKIRRAIYLTLTDHGRFSEYFLTIAYTDNELKPTPEEYLKIMGEQYDWHFDDLQPIDLSIDFKNKGNYKKNVKHFQLPCSRIFRKGEPIYRCLTCGYDDTCALCSDCYREEYHQNHKVHITICLRENGGVCDCGDPEAWVNNFICPCSQETATEIEIPDPILKIYSEVIEILLDYVIDVISCSDRLFFDSLAELSEGEIINKTKEYTLDPLKYGFNGAKTDENSDSYYLIVYNDQVRHYRDAVQRIHLASKKLPHFAEMVTNKLQSYGKAKVISSKSIPLLLERQKILSATGIASSIKSFRDEFREEMCDEILLWINEFTESEIFRVTDNLKNLFCKAFCSKWHKGISYSEDSDIPSKYVIGSLDRNLNIPKIQNSSSPKKALSNWYFKPKKWDIKDEIGLECEYNCDDSDYLPHINHLGSRFQYFIYFDIRFWKSIRVSLHDMYSTSLITNLSYKNIICCQYVDIYPTIADMFLKKDREPELNVMTTLSTQLFTCPSNSTSIVQHGDISRIFASIYGFLTDEEVKTPERVDISLGISMKSLKNRRWGQIFFDIGYILSRSKDVTSILTSNIIPMACDILALFQGKPVMKRESKTHVEYESPDYTAFFHAILVIYQFGESIALCIDNIKNSDDREKKSLSINAINYTIKFLLKLENNEYPGLDDDLVDINLSNDKAISKELIGGEIIQYFRIDKEKVSFLHPIHSFLSWLIQISKFESPLEVSHILDTSMDSYGISLSLEIPNPLTSIFEYPIRTIVLMSQIKSGFWVRNGFSVRSQLQLYKNTGLRESGYLRDIFLIQIFVNSNNPNLVCFLLFSRWLLMDGWIINEGNKLDNFEQNALMMDDEKYDTAYDIKTLPYMLEECLNFIITIVTEDLYLQNLIDEELNEIKIKNEIIHNLCFGPMSYTKLCAHIPDHITSNKRFDLYLDQITIFTPPKHSKDIGSYQLKEKFLDRINPYYFNYSSNIRDDAIKFVKERIRSKTRRPYSDIIIEPILSDPDKLGAYKYIGNFSLSSYFSDFLIKTLKFVIDSGADKFESLLETTLHLIHICSFEQLINIEVYGSFYDRFLNISSNFGTSIAIILYQILIDDNFKDYHSKARAIFQRFEVKYHNLSKILSDQIPDFDSSKMELNYNPEEKEDESEVKKKIAKVRQAKLMAKFKKQQSLFLKNNDVATSDVSDIEMDDGEENGWKFPEPHCLLCQNAAEDAGPFGIITYISKSSEFRNVLFDDPYWFLKSFSDSPNLDKNEHSTNNEELRTENWKKYMTEVEDNNVIGPGFSSKENVECKLVSLSCGHGMHFHCYLNYLNTNRSRLNQITRNTPENIDHNEFLCPLCKAINNMFIPILWNINKRSLNSYLQPSLDDLSIFKNFESSIRDNTWFQNFVKGVSFDVESSSIITTSAIDMIRKSFGSNATGNQQHFRLLLTNMFQSLTQLTFPSVFKADSTFILVNTIKSNEIALRGMTSHGSLVMKQISNNNLINLRILNEFRNTSLLMKIKGWTPTPRDDIYVKMISNILAISSFEESVLETDYLEALVGIYPIPSIGLSFHSILQVCFMSHIMQCLFLLAEELFSHDFYTNEPFSIFDVPYNPNVDIEIGKTCKEILLLILKHRGKYPNESIINHDQFGMIIYSMLIKSCTPFLRRAVIYAYVMCSEIDKKVETSSEMCEADRLCMFLGIKSIGKYLQKFNSKSGMSFESFKFEKFVRSIHNYPKSKEQLDFKKSLEYPGIIKLAKLPDRLDFFFTKYYYLESHKFPHKTIEDPAVCLFCGEVVDSQKPAIGSKSGQCTTHFQKECANNIGIFLLPKDRTLLLLHQNGGSFYEAPFLDQHGELPGETKKAKTLYLLQSRYNDFIRNLWLQHNIPNYIVRKLESVVDAGGWDTL